jgi:hypothetical protein
MERNASIQDKKCLLWSKNCSFVKSDEFKALLDTNAAVMPVATVFFVVQYRGVLDQNHPPTGEAIFQRSSRTWWTKYQADAKTALN